MNGVGMILGARVLLCLTVVFLLQGCIAERYPNLSARMLSGRDRVTVILSVRKEDSSCGLSWLQLHYNAYGVHLPRGHIHHCANGEPTGSHQLLSLVDLLSLLSVLWEHGIFHKAQRLYSPSVLKPKTPPPTGAINFPGEDLSDDSIGIRIRINTQNENWHTAYIAFVPVGAEGAILAEELAESLDGEARELMIRLLDPMRMRE